jgi:hypothetical protein
MCRADDPTQVRRHHLDEPALIFGEQMWRRGVRREDADDAIAIGQW